MARKAMAKHGGKPTVQQIINGQRRNNAELAAQCGIAHDNLATVNNELNRTIRDLEAAQRQLREAHDRLENRDRYAQEQAAALKGLEYRLRQTRAVVQAQARFIADPNLPLAAVLSNGLHGDPSNEARGSNVVMDAARDGYGKSRWRATITDGRVQQ